MDRGQKSQKRENRLTRDYPSEESIPGQRSEFDRYRQHLSSNIRGPICPGKCLKFNTEYRNKPVYVPGRRAEETAANRAPGRVTCHETELDMNFCDDVFGLCLRPCPKPTPPKILQGKDKAGKSYYDELERLYYQGVYNPMDSSLGQTFSDVTLDSETSENQRLPKSRPTSEKSKSLSNKPRR